jgi:hypothetical protein
MYTNPSVGEGHTTELFLFATTIFLRYPKGSLAFNNIINR